MTPLRHLAILLALFATLPAHAQESAPAPDASTEAPDEVSDETPTDSAFVEGEAHDLSKLEEYYNSVKSIGMDETSAAYIVNGEEFEDRGVRYTFNSGYLFPIFSGKTEAEWAEKDAEAAKDAEKNAEKNTEEDEAEGDEDEADTPPARGARLVIGFAFVGGGKMDVGFADPHDAERFANKMVRDWDMDPAKMRAIARDGAPFVTDIEKGWVMGASPAIPEFLSKLPMIGGKRTTSYDQPGVREDSMVVSGSKSVDKAFKQAKRMWTARMEATEMFSPTPKGAVSRDRLFIEKLGQASENATLFGDFLTSTRFGAVMMTKFAPFGDAQDRWLSYVHDESGTWDSSLRTEVFSAGENEYGQKTATSLGGERFPPIDPDRPNSMPWLPRYAHPVWADTTIKTNISKNNFYLNFETTSKLTIKAVGGDLPYFKLFVGKTAAEKNSWEFIDIHLEGENGEKIDVIWTDREEESWKDLYGPMTIILPTALKEGREATVHVQYKGTWSYYNLTEMATGSGSYITSAGLSTGLQDAQPMLLPSFVGQPWKFVTRVGVPADSELRVALSGETMREYEEDGWKYTEAGRKDIDALWPNISVGKWIEIDEPAAGDMPRLRIHLFDEEEETIDGFPPEMRRIITFYQQFLGPWPFPEIDLFQAPDMWFGFVWIAPHAMVNLQKTRVLSLEGQEGYFREDTPNLESGVLAHELAHQYWGHVARPGTIKDFWIAETFAELSACLYVGRNYGVQDYDARMNSYKEKWEEDVDDDINASLTDAYNSGYQPQIVYNYGPYVFKMLRARLGDDPFFRGLNRFLADFNEQSVTTAMLQDTMETAATQRLDVYKADEQEDRAVYVLTDAPAEESIRAGHADVIYDGGFSYDAETNTLTFEGDYIPVEGSQVAIQYDLAERIDLTAFFDFWVYGGYIPNIELTWSAKGNGNDMIVSGDITSDVPFGTFDVPVVVKTTDGTEHATWGTVTDGSGTFETEPIPVSGEFEVLLDPHGYTLAHERSVIKAEQ